MSVSREGARWFGKSLLGYALGIALLALWVDGLGARPDLAIAVNHVLIGTWNYWLTDQWVFQNEESPSTWPGHIVQFAGYQVVMLGSNAGKYVLFLALLWLGVWYLLAWTVAATALLVVSFSGNRVWWQSAETKDG